MEEEKEREYSRFAKLNEYTSVFIDRKYTSVFPTKVGNIWALSASQKLTELCTFLENAWS